MAFRALMGWQQPSEKPFVVCAAGGGYTCVCSAIESLPVAARLNELGYNVFVVNYRVLQDSLLPKPQADLAAAIKYIQKNKDTFGLQNTEYIINGYSAGGSVVTIPPCFIIQAQDDPVVSCENAKALKKLCDKHQIPAQLELPEHGAHGWGDGRGTDAEGWIDRAVRFVEDLK